ncbi:MAG: phosphoglycerate kinase [Gammaproteobacteria bacterium]|nr:phosphoglycerate kinase [Gammaproteobacteria bacterium]
MAIPLLRDFDIRGKSVLVREDLNVPLEDGRVANSARIDAALPTIRHCMAAGARVTLVSHLGRPRPGERNPALSLKPVAKALGDALGCTVRLVDDWRNGAAVGSADVVLLENIRFEAGETTNDPALARRLAALCDVFVMDAFGTAHRAHASTVGVAEAAGAACAGPLLAAELHALGRVLDDPARPLVAVVGGAKVSTKLAVLESLAHVADSIIVGGGIANTFLLASGSQIGASLAEADQVDVARRIMTRIEVPMPVDVMTATAIDAVLPGRLRLRDEVGSDEMVLDIGPETARRLADQVAKAGTVLFNGPLGVFELDQFGEGTRVLAEAIASADAYSVAGGGDTLAAIEKYGVGEGISYQSTGGGAFLEYLAGETLPAVAALERRIVAPHRK